MTLIYALKPSLNEEAQALSRVQKIIMAYLPVEPKAGDLISGGKLLYAYQEAREEGITYDKFRRDLSVLVHSGCLQVTKDYDYRLTSYGETVLSQNSSIF